jgi:multiple sugar transport system substrate-binding protein
VWEGKTQGLLLMGYGSLLFYNEKMLEAAGVKVPTTPDEWLAAIEKTTDRNAGIFGLVATSIEHPNLVGEVGTWVHGLGLDWTRDGRWDFRNPAVVAAVEAYRRSMRFAPPGTNSTVGRQLFVDGKAAFLRDGPWVWAAAARAPEAVRPHLKVARVPFPTVTGGSSNGLHMAATLPREKQEHVWKFMELVASPKWQEQYGILSASPAPRVGSVTEETIRRLPHLKLIQEAAATAVSTFGSIPAVKENYNEFAVIFGRAVMKMISTAEPTAAILAALDADLQRAVPLR